MNPQQPSAQPSGSPQAQQQRLGGIPALTPKIVEQLLNQFKIEKEAALTAGLHTPQGKEHSQKSEKIRTILIQYNQRQKRLSAQAQGTPSPGNNSASASRSGSPSQQPSPLVAQGQQSARPSPGLQRAPSHTHSPQTASTSNISSASSPPQPNLVQRNSQTLTPAQQQVIKSKNLMRLAEQFKNQLNSIRSSKNDPNTTPEQMKALLDREKDIDNKLNQLKRLAQDLSMQMNNSTPNPNPRPPQPVHHQSPLISRANPLLTQRSNTVSGGPQQMQAPQPALKKRKTLPVQSAGTNSTSRPTTSSAGTTMSVTGSGNMTLPHKFMDQPFPPHLQQQQHNNNNRSNFMSNSNNNSTPNFSQLASNQLMRQQSQQVQFFQPDGERVLSKRKLKELIKSIAQQEEPDPSTDADLNVDEDVQELMLDLADELITSVTSFACKLAKHKKSDVIEPKDVQFHLERNWNIRIPGYANDEIKTIKKYVPDKKN